MRANSLGFAPDIAHCNDWHTRLLPLLLKTRHAHNPFFQHTRSVISIHNAAFQGYSSASSSGPCRRFTDYEQRISYDYGHQPAQMRRALCRQDQRGQPQLCQRIADSLGAHGMASIFQQRAADLRGILNGCDYQDWDPAFDDFLPATYDVDNLAGKRICKHACKRKPACRW